MTDYFFTIIDLGTASFVNESSFTQQKDNAPLIKKLGQYILILMSILPIKVINNSDILKDVNENIQCVHGYAYSLGKQKMFTWVNE